MTSYFIYYYTMHCRLQVFEESALKAVTDFRKKKDVPEHRIAVFRRHVGEAGTFVPLWRSGPRLASDRLRNRF